MMIDDAQGAVRFARAFIYGWLSIARTSVLA
jgi:hypothetical protein